MAAALQLRRKVKGMEAPIHNDCYFHLPAAQLGTRSLQYCARPRNYCQQFAAHGHKQLRS